MSGCWIWLCTYAAVLVRYACAAQGAVSRDSPLRGSCSDRGRGRFSTNITSLLVKRRASIFLSTQSYLRVTGFCTSRFPPSTGSICPRPASSPRSPPQHLRPSCSHTPARPILESAPLPSPCLCIDHASGHH